MCAFGDTTRTNINDAEPVTKALLVELETAFPIERPAYERTGITRLRPADLAANNC